ncbi:MAG: Trk system potassium transporter TrkA [Myxococcales bacterium]|nr:Trk system potassium transporter TrkA [Myxococcales bacterium]
MSMRVVIIGAGDVGTFLAKALSHEGAEVIVIDRKPAALDRVEEQADVLTLLGDATHWSTLQAADVSKADITLALTSSDDANVVSAAIANSLNAPRTVARVDDPNFYRTQSGVEANVLGINAAICASRLVSTELLRQVRRVDAEYVGHFAGDAVQIAQVRLAEGAPVLGQAAAQLKIDDNAWVAGVVRDMVLRPPEEIARLEVDDHVLLAGSHQAMGEAIRDVSGARHNRRIVIVGGGDVGYQVASTLVQSEGRVQIIEVDLERCHVLAEALPKVNIIHGDGTNIAVLQDEQIDTADFMLSVTRADEVNLMASLMAADLGVPWTLSLVHRPGYTEVYSHLGIHGTAGSHEQILRTVKWLLPPRGPLAREELPVCTHELVEHQLPSAIHRGVRLGDLALPPDAVAVALVRGATCLQPRAALALEPFDHIIVAAPASSMALLERRIRTPGRGGE